MSGLCALVQTDIVDSTRLNEALGDAQMSMFWAAHDRLSRDLLLEWRGRELDRTDGFLLQFSTVADAVGFALDYHRSGCNHFSSAANGNHESKGRRMERVRP